VGINLVALGEILGDGECVLRGLNPTLFGDDGQPTERNFILKSNDPLDDGPSFGILSVPPERRDVAPLGAQQGIAPEVLPVLLRRPDWGVAQLRVVEALEQVHGTVAFVQRDALDWGDHRRAHAMIAGHQTLDPANLKSLRRHLLKLALRAIVKQASGT
jgi:hypothetical protein